MNDQEKAQMGTQTFVGFCQQFGDDVHAQIFLEELFRGLIYEEALFVFGQSVEEGDQVSDSVAERICDNIEIDGSVESGPTSYLGTPDLPDYP